MLPRRNIAIDAETAQLVAAAVQVALQPVRPAGGPAGARVFPASAASRCPDHDRGALSSRSLLGIAGADRSARPRRDRLTSRPGCQTRRMP
jgi:hypothetical protein